MKNSTLILSILGSFAVIGHAHAALTISQLPTQAGWPGFIPFGTSPRATTTTANPNSNAGTVAQTLNPGSVIGHTFSVGPTDLKLDGFAWTVSGSNDAQLKAHLYEMQFYAPTDGGYQTSAFASGDLLAAGNANSTFTFGGNTSASIVFFDLTGASEVILKANKIYVFGLEHVAGGSFFPMRAGETYSGGSVYQGTVGGGRNNVGGGTRDGIFTAYAAPVPEPTSILALALGGVALLRRRK